MNTPSIKVAISMDPGSTAYLLNPSPVAAQTAFAEVFPETTFEQELALHSPIAGTTINILITGLSMGAGILAGEFLKECGKDLWKAFKKLILPTEKNATLISEHSGNDNVSITLKIGDSTLVSAISNLGSGNEEVLREFVTNELARMYDKATSIIGDRQICLTCEKVSLPVMDLPCRYCTYQGGKLKIINNQVCGLDGKPLPLGVDPKVRKKSFYTKRDDA